MTLFYTGKTRNPRYINPQEHNRYTYALNNPHSYLDPDGHQTGVLEGVVIVGGVLVFVGGLIYYYSTVVPALEEAGVDTSINDGIEYAWNEVKQTVSDIGSAIGGFFGNLFGNNDPENNSNDKDTSKKKTIDENRTDHIFRDAEGHFSDDTLANRAAIEDVANNPNAYNGYSEATGNHYYSIINQNGNQIWAIVRDGKIINGGINLTPILP